MKHATELKAASSVKEWMFLTGGGGLGLSSSTDEQNQNGILAMLDEECLRPGTVTDITFLDKLNTVCAEHQHFESRLFLYYFKDPSFLLIFMKNVHRSICRIVIRHDKRINPHRLMK